MKFLSTRQSVAPVSIRTSLESGLAADGGLFVPEYFPKFAVSDFASATTHAAVAEILLKPFFADDLDLSAALPTICKNTFDFPIPLTAVPGRPGDYFLELYHGPTSAFKDVGARFLANCLETFAKSAAPKNIGKKRTVIVATSGDTGGAVAGAFFKKPNIEVVILFPEGKISPRQEKQLCAWGENIQAFAVKGAFDDCQKIAKEALLDQSTAREWLSANSINLGRIFPQMVYYAFAALQITRQKSKAAAGEEASFIIPSGNLGNSLACLWAKKLGLPIGRVVLALNANRPVAEFLNSGTFTPAATIGTLANAMDVGNPSNLERMRNLFPAIDELRKEVSAQSVSDADISETIRTSEKVWGQALCPHTATAAFVRLQQPLFPLQQLQLNWVLVATAHPAKFETIVEPLVGHAIEIPETLRAILKRPSHSISIGPTYAALLAELTS
jgi:threonine synthase